MKLSLEDLALADDLPPAHLPQGEAELVDAAVRDSHQARYDEDEVGDGLSAANHH